MTLSILRTLCALFALLVFTPMVWAQSALPMGHVITAGDLELSGAFTRAMAPNAKSGGGFVTITNNGTAADRLIGAASPHANMVQLHEMKMDGEIMRMTHQEDGILIPAGETIRLAPGGLHIMFMQVTKPFVEGDEIPVTLTFEKAGVIDILLNAGGLSAQAPTMADH